MMKKTIEITHHKFTRWRLLLLVCTGILSSLAQGEVTLDGSVGPSGALPGPDYKITENLGKRAGSNLFHSFGRFNLNASESATFSGSSGIKNVISRVTGGQASNIDGTLRVTIPNANLYLLNPAGVIFGEHAKLDVPGAFHASTADNLKFQDDVDFKSGDATAGQFLTTAEPEAFGFLDNDIAGISLSGNTGSILEVQQGSTLSLVGGDIISENTAIVAPGGRINIASVASAGEVSFNESGIQTKSEGPMAMGDIHISQDTLVPRAVLETGSKARNIDASGDSAGKIFIRGGNLVMDNSLIASNTFDGNGGGVKIELIDKLSISAPGKTSAGLSSAITSFSYGDGDAGKIAITSDILEIRDDASIDSSIFSKGDGGDITIKTSYLELRDGGKIINEVGTDSTGEGENGSLKIDANDIFLSGKDTVISTKVHGVKDGGDLMISVRDRLQVLNEASIDSSIFSNGDGGDVTINANNLDVFNAGEIISKVETEGTGKGGNQRIDAGSISLSGENTLISTEVHGSGDGGDLVITAEVLEVRDEAVIDSSTFSKGDAGDLTVNADNLKVLDGGRIFNDVDKNATGEGGNLKIDAESIFLSGKDALISTQVAGYNVEGEKKDGGDLTVKTYDLVVQNGALIDSSNSGSKTSGNLVVDAKNIILSGNNDETFTGILNQASENSSGKLGKVSVNADSLKIQNGASINTRTFGAARGGDMTIAVDNIKMNSDADISASTRGSGDAGNILINAGNITLSGKGTEISSEAQPSEVKGGGSGIGSAGDITIEVGDMNIRNSASISTSDFDVSSNADEGTSGNIVISLNDTLRLENNGIISTQTKKANAGNITINNGKFLWLSDSSIETSVQNDKGNGGNIFISTPVTALDNSSIIAQAQKGQGGNITIRGFLFKSPNSIVSASSELGIDGNIDLKPETNISGSLAVLPDSFLDASQQISERCVARSGNKLSSFVVKGRGGVPLSPGGLAPSDFKDYLKPKDYSLQDKISESIIYHRSLENNKTSSHLGLGGNYQYASRDIDCTQY